MKKFVSLGLAVLTSISLLAGCGNSGNTAPTNTGAPVGTTAAGEEKGGETSAEDLSGQEHVDITMLLVSPNSNETELEKIAAKLSEITEAKFNTTLHLIAVTPADYTNKMNMMLASGDTLDIFQGFAMYSQYVSQGYMKPIEEYEAYYQDALEVVGDGIHVAQQNGHTYGIPFMNLGATGGDAYGFRKDIIDELGINLAEVKTWDDFGDALRQIKAAYPEMTPLMGGSTEPAIYLSYGLASGKYADSLGDSTLIGVLDPVNNQEVTANYLRDDFKKACEYAWEWAKEGLVGYDEVTIVTDLVKAGKAAVAHTMDGPMLEHELQSSTGYEIAGWSVTDEKNIVTTNNAWTWSITDYCEYPERALQILNEFYINADMANLLEWGIEGEHYRIVDEEKGIVDFIEGQHMGNVTYYNYIKDNIPNCYLCYTGASEAENKWELYQEFKETRSQNSPYLGFMFDQTPVQNQVAACTNVADKYVVGLLSGLLDPATEYDKMVAELETAGIQQIVDEAQAQLDAWIEANK